MKTWAKIVEEAPKKEPIPPDTSALELKIAELLWDGKTEEAILLKRKISNLK